MSPSLRPAHVRLPQAKLTRIETLRAAPRNARTHSSKQLRQLADSISTFGFTNPVLVHASGEVIAGHGRLAEARMLGLTEVPTLCLDWLSDEQKRAYVIVDNRLLIEIARNWQPRTLLIEDKGSGTALIQQLRTEPNGITYPTAFVPKDDKLTRLHSQSAWIEAGHVWLPEQALWLEDIRVELSGI